MRWSDDDPTFLLTSDDVLPDAAFHGFGFVGDDLVGGAAGAQQFREVRGREIPVGEDGAYAVLTSTGDGWWRLGTDHKGFCHVFYAVVDGHWVVSNSLVAVVRHLRARGLELEVDFGQLASWAASPDLVRALMSFDTVVRGVRLLPSTASLRLRPGPSPRLELGGVDVGPTGVTTYHEALAQYLDVWSARFRTVLTDERFRSTVHVSGGRDSRTVLAVAMASVRDLGHDVHERIHFYSQLNRADDFAVASLVADELAITLNHPFEGLTSRSLSAYESFTAWEEAFVGCYSQTMFRDRARDASHIVLAGVGGEAHRTIYGPRIANLPIDRVAEVSRPRFRDPTHFESWKAALVESDDHLRTIPLAHPNAMMRNHREFRDRFHTGKDAVWRVAALMLGGRHLVECSNLLSPESFDNGQILFDIMANTTPELVHLPFDLEKKAPTATNLQDLARLDWAPGPRTGRVFMEPTLVRGEPPTSEHSRPLAYVLERAERVFDLPEVMRVIDAEWLTAGLTLLREHVDQPRQNLHERGRPAHLAFLADLLLG